MLGRHLRVKGGSWPEAARNGPRVSNAAEKMKMICRMWNAEATSDQADAYQAVALTKIIPSIEARNIPGFLHIDVLRYPLPNRNVRFATLMWFDTDMAIKAFAGEDREASYLPPEITLVLSHYDRRATHFEVVARRPQ